MKIAKKTARFLFDRLICKTPEKWRKMRAFFVSRYLNTKNLKWKTWSIGRKCRIHSETVIGEKSGVGYACMLDRNVTIGNYVMMGPEVLIYTRNHRHDDTEKPMATQGFGDLKPVVIEDDVWIGARAIILPGVTIGKGSIVGAGAVVAKSIPPYSVAVGNPARVVKTRTDEGNS